MGSVDTGVLKGSMSDICGSISSVWITLVTFSPAKEPSLYESLSREGPDLYSRPPPPCRLIINSVSQVGWQSKCIDLSHRSVTYTVQIRGVSPLIKLWGDFLSPPEVMSQGDISCTAPECWFPVARHWPVHLIPAVTDTDGESLVLSRSALPGIMTNVVWLSGFETWRTFAGLNTIESYRGGGSSVLIIMSAWK